MLPFVRYILTLLGHVSPSVKAPEPGQTGLRRPVPTTLRRSPSRYDKEIESLDRQIADIQGRIAALKSVPMPEPSPMPDFNISAPASARSVKTFRRRQMKIDLPMHRLTREREEAFRERLQLYREQADAISALIKEEIALHHTDSARQLLDVLTDLSCIIGSKGLKRTVVYFHNAIAYEEAADNDHPDSETNQN